MNIMENKKNIKNDTIKASYFLKIYLFVKIIQKYLWMWMTKNRYMKNTNFIHILYAIYIIHYN